MLPYLHRWAWVKGLYNIQENIRLFWCRLLFFRRDIVGYIFRDTLHMTNMSECIVIYR